MGALHILLTIARRVLKIHKASAHNPKGHIPLLLGHVLELGAMVCHVLEASPVTEGSLGVLGAGFLLVHVLTYEI